MCPAHRRCVSTLAGLAGTSRLTAATRNDLFYRGVRFLIHVFMRDSFDYWLNRKNCCVPEIRLVTAFCPLTTTGSGETVVQTAGETRFVVDCKVNTLASVGHVKIRFGPERVTLSCGALTDPNERLNIVPLNELPP